MYTKSLVDIMINILSTYNIENSERKQRMAFVLLIKTGR